MNVESWGGGLVLLLVAALWLVYLVPTWHRRRQYLATERNAVRLQQTLRILAETSEVPEEVHVEANARAVAEAQRVVAAEERKRDALRRAREAARQREVTRQLAAAEPVLRAADHDPALAARRLRRSRLVSTLVLVASVVLVVVGLVDLAASWLALVAGLVFGAMSVAVLAQLAAVSAARARRQVERRTVPEGQPLRDFADSFDAGDEQQGDAPRTATRTWTPVPLPKPLYLRRGRLATGVDADVAAHDAGAGAGTAGAAEHAGGAGAAAAAARARRGAAEHDVRDAPVERVTGGRGSRLRAVPAAPVDPAAELRAVAARDAAALREAQHAALREAALAESALEATRRAAATPVTAAAPASREATPQQVPEAPVAPAPPSPFARMGIVDDEALGEAGGFSVDEALRRRRAV